LQKLGPILFEANHCQHSLWWELLMLYGFFFFFVTSFLVFTLKTKKLFQVDQFVLLLIILSTLLIILPELIYVKDIYPAHYRANTMFKLVFQAFMMLSLASGYIMVRLISQIREQKSKIFNWYTPFFILSFLLFVIVLLYPQQAVKGYYGDFKTPHGLDGTAYLKSLYPGDYKAIQWLNINVHGQPVILEAQGDSYTDYARFSTNTGLPTVLGWTVHEWLWRGTYDIPAPRIEEIKTMYETADTKEAAKLLKKYNVIYVIIGSLEKQKYPKLTEGKFKQLGKIVFEENNTKIYQLK
jgi:YYY domain-containing protein